MAGQQIRDDRASSASVHNCGRRERSGNIIFCRYMTQARQASVFALPLVGQEKEGFVLDDGTAERAAKLVIVEWILWKGGNIEVVAGVEGTVAKVFECGAVELICSRFGYQVYDGARIPARLRVDPGEDRYFSQRIKRQKSGRSSPDTWFIDGRIVVVIVIHIDAIEKMVIRFAPAAVHTEGAE